MLVLKIAPTDTLPRLANPSRIRNVLRSQVVAAPECACPTCAQCAFSVPLTAPSQVKSKAAQDTAATGGGC